MTRNNAIGCRCRVPLHEAAIPVFASDRGQAEWLAERGVEVAPDHRGQPSITLEAAYQLRELADEAVELDRVERVRRAEKLAVDAAKAQVRRQQIFAKALQAAGIAQHPQTSLRLAWESVHEAESDLPPEVVALLDGVSYDGDLAMAKHLGAMAAAGV